MASRPDSVTEEFIAFYAAAQPEGYCGVAVTVVVVYDWIVTLLREVQLFWTGKARPLSSVLYLSNKYLNLFAQIINMLSYAPISDKSCTGLVIANGAFIYSSFLPPAAFAGLRAYALTRRLWLSTFVFLLSSTQFATNMAYFGFGLSGTQIPMMGCQQKGTMSPSLIQMFFLMNRISTILADTVLIAITWKQFLHEDSSIQVMKNKGLTWVMLCDGMIYFVVILVLNVTNLVLTEVSTAINGDVSLLARFATPLSSVLVSHFLLDLQEAHQRKVVGLDTDDPMYTLQSFGLRSANLVPALGSLGATINPAYYGREEHDECTDIDSVAPRSVPQSEEEDTRLKAESTIANVSRGEGDERVMVV